MARRVRSIRFRDGRTDTRHRAVSAAGRRKIRSARPGKRPASLHRDRTETTGARNPLVVERPAFPGQIDRIHPSREPLESIADARGGAVREHHGRGQTAAWRPVRIGRRRRQCLSGWENCGRSRPAVAGGEGEFKRAILSRRGLSQAAPAVLRPEKNLFHVFPRGDRIGRAVRATRYRLVEWKIPGAAAETADLELYDYEADPLETKNLASARPEVVSQLRTLLAQSPKARPQIRGPKGAAK